MVGPAFSALADADELRFREQIEPARDDPEEVAAWIERRPRLSNAEFTYVGWRPA